MDVYSGQNNGVSGTHSPGFTKAGDSVIFFAQQDGFSNLDLYVTDGTPDGTSLIVDFGTATTFDVIDKKLSHIGSIIIPGALTAHYSLLRNTSMIKTREIILTNKLLGSSTSECLSSGFVNGQVHMIRGIVQEIQQTSKLKFKVLVTGGISNIFLEAFKDYEYHSSLVLNGIVNYINKSNYND